ncbi:MAG: hypothetical protein ABI550_01005, partial [Ignavibacteriaceae bacterium]
FFNGIVPCGIFDKQVTSLSKELNKEIKIKDVKENLLFNFKKVFNYDEIISLPKEDIIISEAAIF